MDAETKRLLIRMGIDATIVCSIGLAILAFYVEGQPFRRGFFCTDDSLKFPYFESTVTSAMLYGIGIGLPVLLIVINEIFRRSETKAFTRKIGNFTYPGWLVEAYKIVGVFAFGAVSCQLLSNVAKYTVGRLRPHFYYGCIPTLTEQYFHCTSTNVLTDRMLRELRLSFPSGYSSFATYTMLFGVFYIHARTRWTRSTLPKFGIQLAMITCAIYCCLSRISDYQNHWSDVLAGAALGATMAFLVAKCCAKLFDVERKGDTSIDSEEELIMVEREN